jgi:crotonobetainyl-CoA:carnitine CoA-transferase CaiB-like acyl-CoA transferase
VGPDAGRGGFDLILQAESGVMSVTGAPECGPVKVGAPVLDVGAGLSCALGLVAAHVERLRTGVGTHVSSSLLEFALTSLGTLAAATIVSGRPPSLLGTHSPVFAPYGGFPTSDGWIVVAGAGSEEMWVRFCRALGLEALVEDPRFADNAARVRHRDDLSERISEVLRSRTSRQWLDVLDDAGVPAAEVEALDRVLDGGQTKALGALQTLEHASAGPYRVVGAPLRIDLEPLPYPRPASAFGADTREVLSEVGVSADEIDALVAAGLAVAP